MKQIPDSKGGRPAAQAAENAGGADPSVTRTQAARDAGLSEYQSKTTLRVAEVDDAQFEAAVESDNPRGRQAPQHPPNQ